MTNAVHRGGLNAVQSLAFFRANNITGNVLKSRARRCVLVEYSCLTEFLDGTVAVSTHRILAPASSQHIAR